VATARLVCRAWRDCLGAQVTTAYLPPTLWQHDVRGQLAQLRTLADAYPLLHTVQCQYARGAAVDARAMRRTMGLLARAMPSLTGLRLRGMTDAFNWPAVSEGIVPLAYQLTCLDLSEACWPDAPSLRRLATALPGLRRLRLHSAVFSRMGRAHVEAIAGLGQLRELSLGFRTVEGTGAAPLALDPLAGLVRLVDLELEYTGGLGHGWWFDNLRLDLGFWGRGC